MSGPRTKPRRRIRKWLKRLAFTTAALLAAAVATPFVFTGPLVRYGLAHSDYRHVPLRFRSASLSPTGLLSLALTLHDVVIDDTEESAGKPLFAASAVHIDLALNEISANRLRTVSLDNIDLTLRPGADIPLTLLRLLPHADPSQPAATAPATTAPASTAPAAPAPAAPANPLWFDQLIVTGNVRLEDYEPWLTFAQVQSGDPVPVQLVVRSSGSPDNPQRDVSLIAGSPQSAARPSLTTRFSVLPAPDGATLTVEQLIVSHPSPAVTEGVLRVIPALPPSLRRTASAHFDRLITSGTLTLGPQNRLDAAMELRDLSLRSGYDVALEHFSVASRVEGPLTANPLKDLHFGRTHCTWDAVQWSQLRLARGAADLQLDGSELVLSDLQARVVDADLRAIGAWNIDTGMLTRGRVWLDNFAAAKVLPRLPADVRQSLPVIPDGTLSARVFLTESAADHLAAHVELVCPDDLVLNPRQFAAAPAGAPPVTAADTAPAAGAAPVSPGTFAVLSNMNLTGTVDWHFRDNTFDIARGRLTADQLLIVPDYARRGLEGLPITRIKSDFSLQDGVAWLEHFYADLPGNGRVNVSTKYHQARPGVDAVTPGPGGAAAAPANSWFIDDVMLSLNGVDAVLVNPWLPGDWTLMGQFDAEIRGGYSPREVSLNASLGLASQTVLQNKNARLTVTGAPAITLRGTCDPVTFEARVELAEISGVNDIRADADLVRLARTYAAPAPGGAPEAVFEAAKTGAQVSFDKLAFEGPVRFAAGKDAAAGHGPAAAGTLTINGLDLAALADDKAPSFLNLTLKTGLELPLPHPAWNAVRLTDGSFGAEKITLGQNVFTELSGSLTLDRGKAAITHASLIFAEGSVEGHATFELPSDIVKDGAAIHTPAQLDSLLLNFTGLHQQVLSRAFYPDVISAEGPISGSLSLAGQTGVIGFKADQPGKLKLSRDASQSTFAPIARAAAESPDTILPENFEDIIMNQLADYPYTAGTATLTDNPGGLSIELNYTRRPLQEGEPGYAVPVTVGGKKVTASLPFNIQGGSITVVDFSIRKLLRQMAGFRSSLSGPATRP